MVIVAKYPAQLKNNYFVLAHGFPGLSPLRLASYASVVDHGDKSIWWGTIGSKDRERDRSGLAFRG